jgi:hypothetical protein
MTDLYIRSHFNRENVDQNSGDYSAFNPKILCYNHDNLSIKTQRFKIRTTRPLALGTDFKKLKFSTKFFEEKRKSTSQG